MKIQAISPITALYRSFKTVIKAARSQLVPLLTITIIAGLSPSFSLFLNKLIIDQVTPLVGTLPYSTDFRSFLQKPGNYQLFFIIIVLIIFNFFTDAIKAVNNFYAGKTRDKIKGHVELAILQKLSRFPDIALFENPQLLNLIKLSEKGIGRMEQLSFIVIALLNSAATFIPAILFSFTIVWWVPVSLIFCVSPSIYFELYYREKAWFVERSQADVTRRMDLYKMMLTNEIYAKEIRLLDLQNFFIKRWQNLFKKTFQETQAIRKRGTIWVVAFSLLSAIAIIVPYFYLIKGTLEGNFTLGDLALYAGLIVQLRQGLYIFINNGSELYDVVLGTIPFFQLLDLEPQLKVYPDLILTHQEFLAPPTAKIDIQNLSFAYPDQESLILNNINLTIQDNEIIALVGNNAAGKTTLTKLLCRLYDPTEGQILWNQQNIKSIELEQHHRRIATVLQDYAQFPATLRENIAFGNLDLYDQDKAIWKTLEQVNLASSLKWLPHPLETPLGRELEQGIELSGGQWQRLAIARALIRLSQAELLILDEPTAALDANIEERIYELFQEICLNKMTIFISHRLALCKLAHRIVVLEKGQIIEIGNHNELIAEQGQYYKMFKLQANRYI